MPMTCSHCGSTATTRRSGGAGAAGRVPYAGTGSAPSGAHHAPARTATGSWSRGTRAAPDRPDAPPRVAARFAAATSASGADARRPAAAAGSAPASVASSASVEKMGSTASKASRGRPTIRQKPTSSPQIPPETPASRKCMPGLDSSWARWIESRYGLFPPCTTMSPTDSSGATSASTCPVAWPAGTITQTTRRCGSFSTSSDRSGPQQSPGEGYSRRPRGHRGATDPPWPRPFGRGQRSQSSSPGPPFPKGSAGRETGSGSVSAFRHRLAGGDNRSRIVGRAKHWP